MGSMTSGTLTALQVLRNAVDTDMASRVPGYDSYFGWREPTKQQTAPVRVVWTPGDETGSLGQEMAAQKVAVTVATGQTARNLVDLDEAFHVQIQASDTLIAEDEEAQYNAVRMIWDAWRACAYRATHGQSRVGFLTLVSARWKVEGANEKRRGACLIVTGRIRSPNPDDAHASTTPHRVEIKPLDGYVSGPTIVVE
jgi:hypothetical protein